MTSQFGNNRNLKPTKHNLNFNFYYRPYTEFLLETIRMKEFKNIKYAVWSSLKKEYLLPICKNLFEK